MECTTLHVAEPSKYAISHPGQIGVVGVKHQQNLRGKQA